MESNIPPFIEHNMRFLSYSAALCIEMNRFQFEGQAKMCQLLDFFLNLK